MQHRITALRNHFFTDATRDHTARMDKLDRLERALDAHTPSLLRALHADLHKSAYEAHLSELGMIRAELALHRKTLKRWMKPKQVAPTLFTLPSRSRIYPEPYGVCLVMSPWNYPAQLTLVPLIGAISAGNVAAVKTSRRTPETSRVLHEIIADAFEPHEMFPIPDDVSNEEILAQRYDMMFFTGSTDVGKVVMKAAAEHLTPVVLELGGKSPAIVCEDADIDVAAKRIVFGKLMNAGQTCIAPDYVLVDAKVEKRLIEALKREVAAQMADAIANDTFPKIVADDHVQRLQQLIDGWPQVWGGEVDADRRIVQPAIFTDVQMDSPIMEAEIFGPLLPVVRYDNLGAAVADLQRRDKPLALYLFTGRDDTAQSVIDRVSFGGGCVNDTLMHVSHERLPFGGVGASGMGAYHGKHSFRAFSHMKPVLQSPISISVPFRYRPYSGWKRRVLKRML